MVNSPVFSAPVQRALAGAAVTGGVVQSYTVGVMPYPSEGADQSYTVGVMPYPSEGADQATAIGGVFGPSEG